MQGKTTGLYHFALLLPTRFDLARIVQHFANSGLRFGSSDHLVSEALYLSDPDGNGIEIYRDREPSEWTWNHAYSFARIGIGKDRRVLNERTRFRSCKPLWDAGAIYFDWKIPSPHWIEHMERCRGTETTW
jgi:catechol-2,3-dioxygenase